MKNIGVVNLQKMFIYIVYRQVSSTLKQEIVIVIFND